MEAHQLLEIRDASHAGEARRRAVALAARIGLSPTDSGRVALVVTEAATNIVKHVGSGELLLRALDGDRDGRAGAGAGGVEIIALDRGPGMVSVARCLEDGYSTAGSPGTGLGAIARLASSMDIYSGPTRGTALLARVLAAGTAGAGPSGCELGAVRVPAPGEELCGDDFALAAAGRRAVVLLADGLGHGPLAARAAGEAVRAFLGGAGAALVRPAPAVTELLGLVHGALLPTRGAAVSVAELDVEAGELRFAGVGNVAGLLAWPGASRRLANQNGTLGVHLGPVRVLSYPLRPDGSLVLHSDGLRSLLSPDPYPGLLACHPSLVAAVLYRDFRRGRDDATVVVARARGPS